MNPPGKLLPWPPPRTVCGSPGPLQGVTSPTEGEESSETRRPHGSCGPRSPQHINWGDLPRRLSFLKDQEFRWPEVISISMYSFTRICQPGLEEMLTCTVYHYPLSAQRQEGGQCCLQGGGRMQLFPFTWPSRTLSFISSTLGHYCTPFGLPVLYLGLETLSRK